ncbi:MAG: winged helix-turn-helix domain-containing protein [Sulfuricurvum sp.]|jgi:DNA-binding response OmpR family regulator|uniref:helix-turn-helix domain-containing protein n=1 Tax=Sulfuricurvum sp. IAE1 TaxID=2546102 RepID=UPI00140517D6|nr:helix-turn-helix domain-containing protein [Sulfuricurvum sp. IAE1]MDD3770910.1 helix-turn-helix domain-containing protein [Sulfuricurvum sp.]MDX9966677.1 helix-turn-helix domain-containing protein [Sulfuricurvum sp.]
MQRHQPHFHRISLHQDTYYDTKGKLVVDGDKRVFLSHSEITVLELLLYYRGETLLYETLEYAFLSSENKSRNALKIIVSNLRRKIPGLPIRSIPKIGYILL